MNTLLNPPPLPPLRCCEFLVNFSLCVLHSQHHLTRWNEATLVEGGEGEKRVIFPLSSFVRLVGSHLQRCPSHNWPGLYTVKRQTLSALDHNLSTIQTASAIMEKKNKRKINKYFACTNLSTYQNWWCSNETPHRRSSSFYFNRISRIVCRWLVFNMMQYIAFVRIHSYRKKHDVLSKLNSIWTQCCQ